MRHVLFFLFILTGCCSGPRAAPICFPNAALDDAADEVRHEPLFETCERIPHDWWLLFDDWQLADFIETTLSNNPSLYLAQARIYQAAYTANQVRSLLYPHISWGGDVLRQKLSETGLIPFNQQNLAAAQAGLQLPPGTSLPITAGQNGIPVYFTQYETQLTLAFEFDFWEKNRNLLRAAIGETNARFADEQFARLQLSVAVAKVYYDLQITYKRKELALALVANYEETMRLIQQKIESHLENIQTLHYIQLDLTAAKQALLQIDIQISLHEHQLRAYLATDFQDEICPWEICSLPIPKVPLPLNIPMHLIANRPDITAQLWLIYSAGRQIESAKAGFYPDFNLTGLFGYQTIHFKELFKWPSCYFFLDPAFSLPLFDGGRLKANLRLSEVQYDMAIYHYDELIINAVKETLDGIAVVRNADQQHSVVLEKLAVEEELYQLTQQRIANHIATGLERLASERNLLLAKDQETAALGNTIQAIISLIKALGGGYDCT